MAEVAIRKALIYSILLFAVITGCSRESKVVANERPPEFYNRFVNSAADEKVAPETLHELKILEADETYNMRIALFDNGRVYYQVDRLGDGRGIWRFYKGAIEIVAYRPIFDMQLYISGESATGDSVIVRYYDRVGLNSHPIELRDPSALGVDEEPAPLPEFEKSADGI